MFNQTTQLNRERAPRKEMQNPLPNRPVAPQKKNDDNTNKKHIKTAAITLSAIAAIAVLWMVFNLLFGSGIRGDKYQLVRLANGQDYFGHLSKINDNYAKLTDVYYFQSSSASVSDQASLIKLEGSDVHSPDGTMYINREQIVFWENLQNEGEVVKAIKENKNSGN